MSEKNQSEINTGAMNASSASSGSHNSGDSGDGGPPPLKPFSQSPSPSSSPATPRSAFHPDVPAHQKTAAIPNAPSRQIAGIPGAPYNTANDSGAEHTTEAKQLVIGSDVCLTGGEISSCNHLIVDGFLEDTSLLDASHLDITKVGRFKGSAVVENAVIAGHFEGDLTVRQRLTLKDGGEISGSVRYGSIVIEPGGTIKGNMQSLSDS